MAKDKALSSNAEVKRSKEFQEHLDIEHTVVDVIKENLIEQTEKAFAEKGIEKNDKPAGFYGTGKAYGFGANEGKFTITVQNKTVTSFTKYTVFGGKRLVSDINSVYEGGVLMVQYKTTEDGIFRGIKEKNGQSYTFHKKFILKSNNLSEIKKTIQKIFLEIAQKEVEYLINTRIGVQDKTETGTASTVEENKKINTMKKLTIKELFSQDEILSEGKGKIVPNIDKVKKANTVDLKNGNKKRKMFLDDEKSNKEKDENQTVDEITTTAGGPASAGPFRYDTPYFASKKSKRPKLDKDYNVVPQKNESFYTRVELEPGSGYIPKGMKQNYIQGLHNATPQQLAKWGYGEGQFGVNESNKPDLTKKKIFSEAENIEKGINKKYLITEKTSDEYKKERWSKLSNFKIYESIKESENLDENDYDTMPLIPPLGKGGFTPSDESAYFDKLDYSEEEGDIMNSDSETEYFEKDMEDIQKETLSEETVSVEKPNSSFGTQYKFYKKDFLNEGKKYILDLNTMTFVINPNSL